MPGTRRSKRGARPTGTSGASEKAPGSPVEVAIRFLGSRRRFEREVASHLRKKGFSAREVDESLERLRELELLSDEETCRAFVRDRLNFAPKGRSVIRIELLKRGVPEEIVEPVLDEMLTSEVELGSATDALRRSRAKLSSLSAPVARRRMWSALARRGYEPETVKEAIRRFAEECELDPEEGEMDTG